METQRFGDGWVIRLSAFLVFFLTAVFSVTRPARPVGTRIPCRLVRDHLNPLWGERVEHGERAGMPGGRKVSPTLDLFIRRERKGTASLAVFSVFKI